VNNEHDEGAALPHEVAHAGMRGAIGAAAMSGMRNLTVGFGLVGQTPPEAIVKQRAHGVVRMIPRKKRKAGVELMHWAYGAAGGAAFALLPESLRRQPWAGPAYGLVVWLGFELGIAPLLGLKQAKQPRPVERAALAADHLLYGLVLSEGRRRPQE
jgi:hypothetical protein